MTPRCASASFVSYLERWERRDNRLILTWSNQVTAIVSPSQKRGDDSIAISRFIISCLGPLPCDAIFPSDNNNNNNNVGCCKSRCGNRHSCPCARPNPFFHAPLSDTPATWRCLPLKMNQDAPVFFFWLQFFDISPILLSIQHTRGQLSMNVTPIKHIGSGGRKHFIHLEKNWK